MVEVGDWRISPDIPAHDAGSCKIATPAPDSATPASTASESTTGTLSDAPATSGTEKSLSAEAPEFEPILCTATAAGAPATASPGASMGARMGAQVEPVSIRDMLPPSHVECLRGSYSDAYGQHYPYYVGCLKTFSKRNGYGFLECKQAFDDFGHDVFIHHNYVKQPMFFDQPVEFAVTQNQRLQPQAFDVQWLPRLPWLHTERAADGVAPPENGSIACSGRGRGSSNAYPSVSSSVALATLTRQPATDGLECPSAASVLAAVTSTSGRFDAPGTGAAVASRPPAEDVRHLGVLKSYSEAQGYGFILCPEVVNTRGKRDVYFDRFQIPANQRWMFGQTVEFTVLLNSAGHPQARSINWEPVPQIPRPCGGVLPPPGLHQVNKVGGAAVDDPRRLCHGASTLAILRGFMAKIRSGDADNAVLLAVQHQHTAQDTGGTASGGTASANAKYDDADVDLVLFVIDRLPGARDEAARNMKDMVKLVLLTMLCKMLKVAGPRCVDLLAWFHSLVNALDVESAEVRSLIGGVAETAGKSAKDALENNPQLKDKKLKDSLKQSLARLSATAKRPTPNPGNPPGLTP
mmetsp:Transcript_25207/g.71068  ORF Transcript_25207/g.71068 Transcript_25207/m.71068 type:complete len:578 (+) Transcript_25207:42-1775(+)